MLLLVGAAIAVIATAALHALFARARVKRTASALKPLSLRSVYRDAGLEVTPLSSR